jgi:hypothetical protein
VTRSVVEGTISSAGFNSGDRFAVGCWWATPLGPFGDVMWVTPDDVRILLAPDDEVAGFITSIYDFDEVRTGPVAVQSDGRRTTVDGGGVRLALTGGPPRPLPVPRPLWFTRRVEGPIARRMMGVRTAGTSPTGVREWYQTRGWRWVQSGAGSIDGDDLGDPIPIERPLGVGFSEPPRRPSIVAVKVTIERPHDPGGR